MVAARRLFSRDLLPSWLWPQRSGKPWHRIQDPKHRPRLSFQIVWWSIHSTVSLKGLTIPLILPSSPVQTYWSAYAQMCHRLGPVVAHPVLRVTDAHGTTSSLASSLGRITSRAEAGGRPSRFGRGSRRRLHSFAKGHAQKRLYNLSLIHISEPTSRTP